MDELACDATNCNPPETTNAAAAVARRASVDDETVKGEDAALLSVDYF